MTDFPVDRSDAQSASKRQRVTAGAHGNPNEDSISETKTKRALTLPANVITLSSYPANAPIEDKAVVAHHDASGATLLAVFDGHGGALCSEFAKKHYAPNLFAHLNAGGDSMWGHPSLSLAAHATVSTDAAVNARNSNGNQKRPEGILAAIASAQLETEEAFVKHAREIVKHNRRSRGKNAGSCVCAVLVRGDDIFTINAGDSRAVRGQLSSRAFPRPTPLRAGGQEHGESDPVIHHSKAKQVFSAAVEPLDECRAMALTLDHNCYNPEEVAAVCERSADASAIRVSKHDPNGSLGLLRVAGSLTVTRCLGDLYLKMMEFSKPPFTKGLPYVSAEPEVSRPRQWKAGEYIIIASDGLWDYLSDKEACACVDKWIVANNGRCAVSVDASAGDPGHSGRNCENDGVGRKRKRGGNRTGPSAAALPRHTTKNVSDALVDAALTAAARKHSLTTPQIRRRQQGRPRREVHDDITVIVAFHPRSGVVSEMAQTLESRHDIAIVSSGEETICDEDEDDSLLLTQGDAHKAIGAFSSPAPSHSVGHGEVDSRGIGEGYDDLDCASPVY